MDKIVCSTTKKDITNDVGNVQFLCPKCQQYTIVRSKQARQMVAKYTCPSCGFEGPN